MLKQLRTILTITLWTIVGLYVAVITLLRTPAMQRLAGEAVETALARKLGTKVTVGSVDPGLFNRFIIDDVVICDQQGKPMVSAGRIAVSIDIFQLMKGRVAVATAQLFGAKVAFYKPSATAPANYQFALDSLASKDKSSKSRLDIRVNTLIMRHSSFSYDRLDIAPLAGRFSTAHINVSDISANIRLRELTADSISATVKRLSFNTADGLHLSRLTFNVEAGKRAARLSDFQLRTPGSRLVIPHIEATYRLLPGGGIDKAWLRYDGEIGESTIAPADFASFYDGLRQFSDPVALSASFAGSGRRTTINRLKITTRSGSMALNAGGWYVAGGKHPEWHADVRNLRIRPAFLAMLKATLSKSAARVPEVVDRLGAVTVSGVLRGDSRCKIGGSLTTSSDAGFANVDASLTHDGVFAVALDADNIDLGRLAANDKAGHLTARLDISGHLRPKSLPVVAARGTIEHIGYSGYDYKNIALDGAFDGTEAAGHFAIDDPNVSLKLDGRLGLGNRLKRADLKAVVNRIAPQRLQLTDRWGDAVFSGDIEVEGEGSGLADAQGRLDCRNLRMESTAKNYSLEALNLKSWKAEGRQFMRLRSDFANIDLAGHFTPTTAGTSLLNIVRDKLPSIDFLPKTTAKPGNEFLMRAVITRTDWLKLLFGVPVDITEPVEINGKVAERQGYVYMNVVAPDVTWASNRYKDTYVSLTTPDGHLRCEASTVRQLDDGDTFTMGLTATAFDDKLSASVRWNGTGDKALSGQLDADAQLLAYAGRHETHVDIKPSHINIDGTRWDVRPSSIIWAGKRLMVDRFSVSHGRQHIYVDGTASASASDSLKVDLNDVNLEYVLGLVNFHAVDFAGQASGQASLASLFATPSVDGQLKVKDFKFEGGGLGTLDAKVKWNPTEKQVDIAALAHDGPGHTLAIDGFVSPARNCLELDMRPEGASIAFLGGFADSFADDLTGQMTGRMKLAGPLNALDLTGRVVVDGMATIRPLGCRYELDGDTLSLEPGAFILNNARIKDSYGHTGYVSATLRHDHFSNLQYDVNVRADNLLAYNFNDFGDDSFYGKVFASGSTRLRGRSGQLDVDVNIRPEKNSTFVYNVSDPNSISNQEFIDWNDRTPVAVTGLPQPADSARVKPVREFMPGTDIHINFIIDLTPDATIRLLMDQQTNDYITLTGTGALRASYHNRGGFNMYGTVTVDHGTYGITIQNILHKNFVFQEGGTIVFNGDPFDALLGLQAVYTVNGVSLSDLNIGNSFSKNTTRVNCLMNIGGQARQPQISFDIDLPTVSSDEKQMVRSVLNSEDEMNQQVLYLLGIGRFYPQGNNNATVQNEKQQSQTTLAMQSLLSGTISSQINTLLGAVVKNNNWNFGANISTGDEGWNNAEYEGLLSGRLLNNRLLINGQFGYRDNAATANTSFIGDFDIRYLLLPNGNIALKVYNQTNDRYFTRSSLNTQGLGLIMKRDFNSLSDLFGIKKKKKKK